MISKIISGVIAVGYVAIAYFAGGAKEMCVVLCFLPVPLACIWFSDELGQRTGFIPFINWGRPAIDETSPGFFVALLGWMTLLMPAIIGLIVGISVIVNK